MGSKTHYLSSKKRIEENIKHITGNNARFPTGKRSSIAPKKNLDENGGTHSTVIYHHRSNG